MGPSTSNLLAIMVSLGFQQLITAVPISGLDRNVMSYGLTTRDANRPIIPSQAALSARDSESLLSSSPPSSSPSSSSAEALGKELLDLHQRAMRENIADATMSSETKDAADFDAADPLKRPLVFPDVMGGVIHPITKVSLPDWRVAMAEWETIRGFSRDDMAGFEPSGRARRVRLQQSHNNTIVDGIYAEDGGFLVVSTADAGRADRLPVFELVWQSFADVAGDRVKNLKAIYLPDLGSDEFKRVIGLNYEDSKQDKGAKVAWEIKNNPRPQRLQRLVGVEPVSSILMMLMSHHQKLGNKEVAKIVTMPAKDTKDLNKVTIAMILEDLK